MSLKRFRIEFVLMSGRKLTKEVTAISLQNVMTDIDNNIKATGCVVLKHGDECAHRIHAHAIAETFINQI